MSTELDVNAAARIIAPVRGVAWLVDMHFTTGVRRYTNWGLNVPSSGGDYTGFGDLAEVAPFTESENTTTSRLVLKFSLVNQALMAATIGNVDTYRGRPVHLSLQLFDENFQPDGAPVRRWSGYMDKVSVTREKSGQGGSKGKIEMTCSRPGMARARNFEGLRLSDAQQKLLYPGDRGLEFIQNLIEQPTLWLSKKFQEVE